MNVLGFFRVDESLLFRFRSRIYGLRRTAAAAGGRSRRDGSILNKREKEEDQNQKISIRLDWWLVFRLWTNKRDAVVIRIKLRERERKARREVSLSRSLVVSNGSSLRDHTPVRLNRLTSVQTRGQREKRSHRRRISCKESREYWQVTSRSFRPQRTPEENTGGSIVRTLLLALPVSTYFDILPRDWCHDCSSFLPLLQSGCRRCWSHCSYRHWPWRICRVHWLTRVHFPFWCDLNCLSDHWLETALVLEPEAQQIAVEALLWRVSRSPRRLIQARRSRWSKEVHRRFVVRPSPQVSCSRFDKLWRVGEICHSMRNQQYVQSTVLEHTAEHQEESRLPSLTRVLSERRAPIVCSTRRSLWTWTMLYVDQWSSRTTDEWRSILVVVVVQLESNDVNDQCAVLSRCSMDVIVVK